jgi:hypothetical protein
MVQDRTTKDFDGDQCQRDMMKDELENMRQLLEENQRNKEGRQRNRISPNNITDKSRGWIERAGYDPDENTAKINVSHYTHHVSHG